MTPYQFSRASQRQRMLAGLNTLGFAIPPTAESLAAGRVASNSAIDLKVGNATVSSMNLSSAAQANTVAAPGLQKGLVRSTLQAPAVGSGIDARNASASKLLTAAGDTLNLRQGSLTALPAKSGFLPGSTINPTRPDVAESPFLKVDSRLERAKTQVAFSTERSTAGQQLVESTKPKSEPVVTGGSTESNDGRSTGSTPTTSTPDPRSSFLDTRPPIRDDRDLREDFRPPDLGPPLFPQVQQVAPSRFPTAMVVAGVGVVGLLAFLFLRK